MTRISENRHIPLLRKYIMFLAVILCIFTGSPSSGNDLTTSSIEVLGAHVHVVKVNIAGHHIEILPLFPPGYSEVESTYPTMDFASVLSQYKPLAAINGTFFDSGTSRTVCNVVYQGKLICEGDIGTALCVDWNDCPKLLLITKCRGRNIDWRPYKFAISGGPTLIYNNTIFLKPGAEGFKDPSLFYATSRTAIGISSSNELMLVTINTPVSLLKLAEILLSLKVKHAINLDGGSSTALYSEGNTLSSPGRRLTNFILLFRSGGFQEPDYPSILSYIEDKDREKARKYHEYGFSCAYTATGMHYLIKACQVDPAEVRYYTDVAEILENTGQKAEAGKFLGKASLAAFQKGDAGEALRFSQKGLILNPGDELSKQIAGLSDHGSSPLSRGLSLLHQKKYYAALGELERAQRVQKNEPLVYYGLARSFAGISQFTLAEHMYRSACQFFLQKGRPYEAYLAAKHALEFNPESKASHLLLADVAATVNKKDVALRHLEIALLLDPGDEKIRQRLEGR